MTSLPMRSAGRATIAALAAFGVSVSSATLFAGGGQTQLPTTVEDFFQPGTQPGIMPEDPFGIEPFQPVGDCAACHGDFGQPNDPPQGPSRRR